MQTVVDEIEGLGYEARPMPGKQRTTVGLMGNDGKVDSARIQGLLGVLEIIPVTKPYKQVSREWRDSDTVVELDNGVRFGGEEINIIAGPCAVEGASDILEKGVEEVRVLKKYSGSDGSSSHGSALPLQRSWVVGLSPPEARAFHS